MVIESFFYLRKVLTKYKSSILQFIYYQDIRVILTDPDVDKISAYVFQFLKY